MWVLIELESFTASQKSIKHAGVGSWFSSLQPASSSFVASKWGELVEWKNIEDNNFSRKLLRVKTKLNEIICERFKVIIQGNVHWVRAKEMEGWDLLLRNKDYASSSSDEEKEQENEGSQNGEKYESDKEVDKVSESSCMQGDALFYDSDNNKSKESNVQSEDPFNIYDLLNKNKNKESDGNSKEGELKYTSGFTQKETSVNEVHEKEMEAPSEEVKQNSYNSIKNNSVNASYCSQRFKAGGSIIDLMDELVKHEWYGSVFNVQSAAAFNNFISLASLIDLPLDGYAYTWVHKSATKMSKLDRLLISKGLMASFPHLQAIFLDKHLSDHRPILMHEMNIDYGPTPPVSHRICPADVFNNQLSLEQQDNLEQTVSIVEIKRAVWDCGTNKSPGPDGTFPKGCNSSFIALIPKTRNAKTVKDFRPIGLNGSLYKIIAKILANRLSSVIPDLISDVQSAFISNRQILDSPFILNELLSWCKYKKLKAMVFKVDFEKAFDSIRNMMVLASQVFFAMNRALLSKWVWRFLSQTSSLWTRTIKAIHGEKGNLGAHCNITRRSPWLDIVREINVLRSKGIDFLSLIRKKVGNGEDTLFWEVSWFDGISLKQQFPRL
nr:RNA-directed DNA polymerase, eukaryota, reverse transcriptase zinc-binding domain protein [Tanacetum cinerariifolium]